MHLLTYPVEPNNIGEVEDILHIKINIFSFFDDEGKGRYPLYVSKKEFPMEMDVLYWKGHYAYIKSFSRFMSDISYHQNKKYFCKTCLGHCQSKKALEHHKTFCSMPNQCNQVYVLPEAGTDIHFKNIRYQQWAPFAIYSDFEALTTPVDIKTSRSTKMYQHQTPISAAFKIVSRALTKEGTYIGAKDLQMHNGADSANWLIEKLEEVRSD